MAEIINLRRQRKARSRAQRAAEAEQNRLEHGLPKAERARRESEAAQEKRRLDNLLLVGTSNTDDDRRG